MELRATPLDGCLELVCPNFTDARGRFVKTFRADQFRQHGLRTDWQEEYFSVSARHVLRGMHFQVPPAAHAKLVYCLAGTVLDVVVDLRTASATYGRAHGLTLSPEQGNALYIPEGFAHGFLALTEQAVMQYKVTSVHAPAHDLGLRWDSIGFDWPVRQPVLSPRDGQHPALADFVSPFNAPLAGAPDRR